MCTVTCSICNVDHVVGMESVGLVWHNMSFIHGKVGSVQRPVGSVPFAIFTIHSNVLYSTLPKMECS